MGGLCPHYRDTSTATASSRRAAASLCYAASLPPPPRLWRGRPRFPPSECEDGRALAEDSGEGGGSKVCRGVLLQRRYAWSVCPSSALEPVRYPIGPRPDFCVSPTRATRGKASRG